MRKRLGKKGADVFVEAMKKGAMEYKRKYGMKRLKPGSKVNGVKFEYEVKVFEEYSKWRLYENYDEEVEKTIFIYLVK